MLFDYLVHVHNVVSYMSVRRKTIIRAIPSVAPLGAPPFHKAVPPFEGLIYHETLSLVYIISTVLLETLLSVS